MWSRIANRVLLPLKRFPAPTPEALYAGVRTIRWSDHLAVDGTLAVDFTTSQSAITHTHFGALKVKDAIVDQFRERTGRRPSVDVRRPSIRVNVHVRRDAATASLDLSGDSLHRRGYRERHTLAPLKENLAAAVLLRAGWPAIAAAGGALIDPMCGSGTLPIEAALIAGDIAPGLLRASFGFLGWKGHDAAAWTAILEDARRRRDTGRKGIPPIVGYDRERGAVSVALANVERAGLRSVVHIERRELQDCTPVRGRTGAPGLVVVNPPYGERLGEVGALRPLYGSLGTLLTERFTGWSACVLAGNRELGKCLGLRARRRYTVFNGSIECQLLTFTLAPAFVLRHG
jgi:23S rRNA (guanine2445-N2)-methyltransferase / 23S rRNA (guanine2069-N7)-methyltransferase